MPWHRAMKRHRVFHKQLIILVHLLFFACVGCHRRDALHKPCERFNRFYWFLTRINSELASLSVSNRLPISDQQYKEWEICIADNMHYDISDFRLLPRNYRISEDKRSYTIEASISTSLPPIVLTRETMFPILVFTNDTSRTKAVSNIICALRACANEETEDINQDMLMFFPYSKEIVNYAEGIDILRRRRLRYLQFMLRLFPSNTISSMNSFDIIDMQTNPAKYIP